MNINGNDLEKKSPFSFSRKKEKQKKLAAVWDLRN